MRRDARERREFCVGPAARLATACGRYAMLYRLTSSTLPTQHSPACAEHRSGPWPSWEAGWWGAGQGRPPFDGPFRWGGKKKTRISTTAGGHCFSLTLARPIHPFSGKTPLRAHPLVQLDGQPTRPCCAELPTRPSRTPKHRDGAPLSPSIGRHGLGLGARFPPRGHGLRGFPARPAVRSRGIQYDGWAVSAGAEEERNKKKMNG